MGKQMFPYQAIDLWRDVPHHVKDLTTFSFSKKIKTLFAVRTILKSNLNRNFIITDYNLIILSVLLPCLSLFFY